MIGKLWHKLTSISWQFNVGTPASDALASWQYILLALLTFFSCYFGLSAYAILDINEGLYAEVAREMFANKHFIIPYLNGVPYLEKPPLLYWLIALSYRIFGINDFAARFMPSTFTALACLSWFYFGVKCRTPRVAWITSIILLSSLVFLIIGRIVFFDMLLTLWVSLTLMYFYFWYQERSNSHLILSYVFLALAVLTKGFVVLVLVPLIVVIFLWLVKAEKATYSALLYKKAMITFLVIVLPWHIIAMLAQPEFTWEYFINNQLLRFFNMRVPHDYHTGPIYYYLPRVIAYLLPWSLLLPFILPWPLKLRRPFDPLKTLLWTWFLVVLLFFTLSGDKGDYYVVIGISPLAYLIAQKIDEWFAVGKSRFLMMVFVIVDLLVVVAGVIGLLFFSSSKSDFANAANSAKIPYFLNAPITFMIGAMLVYGLLGLYLYSKQRSNPVVPFYLLMGLIIPFLMFYLTVKERTQILYSQVALANYVKVQYEYRPVYLYQDFEAISSFVYYNKEPSMIIDSKSADLYFGSTTDEGKKIFITMADFIQQEKDRSVYVVLKASKLNDFQKQVGNDDFCAVQRNGAVILLSNTAADCKANIEVGEQKSFDLDKVKEEVMQKDKMKNEP